MKIIFQDFDGVLNSHKWIGANQHLFKAQQLFMHTDVDPEAVARLQRIVDATGAKVVVSSTWRLFNSLASLRATLAKAGFDGEVIGKTPQLGGPRGLEIQEWLNNNGPIESFVILDDDSDMVHLKNKLVQTSFDDGLQDEHVEAAIKLLGVTEVKF